MKRWFQILTLLSLFAVPVTAFAHGISEADKQAMLSGGNLRYVWLGASHMLTGYDHLLFLFGVIFFLTNLRDIVKFVTAFTLGHSITLISATLMGITANYHLVDAVIALSVIYKGFDNNGRFQSYLGMNAPNLMGVVFVFGLIHGFGLSTRLQQLPLGDEGVLLRIISFNIGVELGQVAALVIMASLLAAWRQTASFLRFKQVANDGLMFAGFMLFLMQLHGYQHQVYPDDFGFNNDAHHHAHEGKPEERVEHDKL